MDPSAWNNFVTQSRAIVSQPTVASNVTSNLNQSQLNAFSANQLQSWFLTQSHLNQNVNLNLTSPTTEDLNSNSYGYNPFGFTHFNPNVLTYDAFKAFSNEYQANQANYLSSSSGYLHSVTSKETKPIIPIPIGSCLSASNVFPAQSLGSSESALSALKTEANPSCSYLSSSNNNHSNKMCSNEIKRSHPYLSHYHQKNSNSRASGYSGPFSSTSSWSAYDHHSSKKRNYSSDQSNCNGVSQYMFSSSLSSSSAATSQFSNRAPTLACDNINKFKSGSSTPGLKSSHSFIRESQAKGSFNRSDPSSRYRPKTTDRPSKNFDTEKLLSQPFLWVRCSPSDLYYQEICEGSVKTIHSTSKLKELQNKFDYELIQRSKRVIASKMPFSFPPRKTKFKPTNHISSDSSWSSSEEEEDDEEDTAFEELQRKRLHPWRLHDELWYNDPGEMNDGPLCRCSAKARRSGIRHGIYLGEDNSPVCNPDSNNQDRLHHYRLNISPLTNYTSRFPTIIEHDGHKFTFEGFSILAHSPILNYPPCKLIRFNIEYTITLEEEKFPSNFTVKDLELVTYYIFTEILELVDINWKPHDQPNCCSRFHLFPRFSRLLEGEGKELLSMNVVLQYLLSSNVELIKEEDLSMIKKMNEDEWTNFAKKVKGMIVIFPGMKPCSVRVDQIDRESDEHEKQDLDDEKNSKMLDDGFPVIVHFGVRPPQLSYAGNPKYQKAWRDYVKFRHLLANKPKVNYCDRQILLQKEEKLQEMRMKNDLKRDVTVVISSKGFYRTGILCDIIQHALLLPVVVCHLRFHNSLAHLEKILNYQFKDRLLLQLALTHPSYRENFGTNPDHGRNALTNCGIRQPYYGDRRVHFMNTRKRGINMLINIMSRFGCPEETASNINHNERLEFLGDAVVEFLSSIHLYFMFPDLEEGGLATFRAAIVQNQHLAVLAKNLQLEKFMLYAHGSDLCHDLELRHAMANCFEALMGALFLDGDIKVADDVFSNTLFADEPNLWNVWVNYPKHPIQQQEPNGDRHYLSTVPRLKELHQFEDITGIKFNHIRLLARAFTHRSVGFNNLTLGSNQRMEFLGDTVLQLVASEYLYKYFPEHHEGHLSLLRSSVVNNKTQAVVCDDLGMTRFAIYNYAKGELKNKDRADLLEAFLGALYVDKGLQYCQSFCKVCFFPRLEDFILNQDWNDPKSKLQQCCLTLRSIDGGEPDIPIYKVIESLGPTNTRVYKVAVYFRDRRLATGKGHSIQEAEMNAAANALETAKALFPQLSHQKRMIERSVKQQDSPSSRKDDVPECYRSDRSDRSDQSESLEDSSQSPLSSNDNSN